MSGAVLGFSEADLAATAAAYDRARHEAPLTVGHPRHDMPAYGWVKSLTAGAGLEAEPHQVNPEFAEWIKSGALKKISASFYTPDSPQNPVPGVYYLRHVGFLGAQPPAVKGLRAPEFAEAEEGVVEFGEWEARTVARMFRRLREWFIAANGQETADKVIDGYDVDALATEASREAIPEVSPAPAFTEAPTTVIEEPTVTPEQAAALEAENTRLAALVATNAATEKAAAATARPAAHAAFAETLATDGVLLPAQVAVVVAVLDFVAGQEQVVEFGEGEAKQPLAEAVKGWLSALPKQFEFSETATRAKANAAALDLTDATAIAAKAVEFQEAEAKAGRTVSTAVAVKHVTGAQK